MKRFTSQFLRYSVCASLVLTGSLSLATESAAQDSAALSEFDRVFACQSMADDAARLACFDSAVAKLKDAEASGEVVALSRQDADKVEREIFGFNIPSFKRKSKDKRITPIDTADGAHEKARAKAKKSPKRITFDIKSARKTGSGRYRFELKNGQVWQQTESANMLRPKPLKDGSFKAEIRKGALGSYFLKVNGNNPSIRVRRVE